MMEFDQQKAEMPVFCPAREWLGVLGQTEDTDVLGVDFELLRKTCICPKCGSEVASSR